MGVHSDLIAADLDGIDPQAIAAHLRAVAALTKQQLSGMLGWAQQEQDSAVYQLAYHLLAGPNPDDPYEPALSEAEYTAIMADPRNQPRPYAPGENPFDLPGPTGCAKHAVTFMGADDTCEACAREACGQCNEYGPCPDCHLTMLEADPVFPMPTGRHLRIAPTEGN